ncbi:hypothetical protein ACR6U3_003227 [Yersinia enterocolitica]
MTELAIVNPLRNLLVIGTNLLIKNGNISLDSGKDQSSSRQGYIIEDIAGKKSVISWSDIGCGELRISVWWDYEHDKHPQANLEGSSKERFRGASPLAKKQHYRQFVGVVASAYLERESGKYLQCTGKEGIFETYTRSSNKVLLSELKKEKPNGYKTEGRFHL